MNLPQQIEAAQQKNEAKLAAEIAPPKLEIETDALLLLRHFAAWCKERGIKSCPAQPATVAAFIRSQNSIGVQREQIFDALRAIEAMHDNHALPNPVATAAVRVELGRILNIEAPRSWPKADRVKFYSLPIEVRAVIERRAQQDTKALRRLQNEVAQLRINNERTNDNANFKKAN